MTNVPMRVLACMNMPPCTPAYNRLYRERVTWRILRGPAATVQTPGACGSRGSGFVVRGSRFEVRAGGFRLQAEEGRVASGFSRTRQLWCPASAGPDGCGVRLQPGQTAVVSGFSRT
jgi:hypothetical protein